MNRLALYPLMLLALAFVAVGCVSTLQTPTPLPPATLPFATGIPVTPQVKPTRAGQKALPTLTVAPQPTPDNLAQMFGASGTLLKNYQPPNTDPMPLYGALAQSITQFLTATSNSDVSLEGQPALTQLQDALAELPSLPANTKAHVVAIHEGDDQGGSRDLVFVSLDGVMGLPIIGLERLGTTYTPLPPVVFDSITNADDRNFYARDLNAQDLTGDGIPELIYVYEYPGGSGTTNAVTVDRRVQDKPLKTIFHAALLDWAGESDYQIDTSADATSINLTFPWFGAFDQKLLAHPNATQAWQYDEKQDKFVRVSQQVDAPTTPRQQLNDAEYLFRNGDLNGAIQSYQKAWQDASLQSEDFGDSKADPAALAKFRQAMLLGLTGQNADAKKLLGDVQKAGPALSQIAGTYAKNSTGKDGALRGWIAMANAGDLYQLIYDSKAGNLDFPFDADEIYLQGGIVAAYLNTHGDADKTPDDVWLVLNGLGFQPTAHLAADLNGDGTNEFLFVTSQGGSSPNKAQALWLVYKVDKAWRVRSLDLADTIQLVGDPKRMPNSKAQAVTVKLPDAYTPNQLALTWDGAQATWLDATTLLPRAPADQWTTVGGGVLDDDY